jgi:germination protein YpeB
MRKRGVYSVIAAILVVGVTTLASLLYIDRMQFGNRLQGRYQKELYDLIGNVQNLETDLSKVSVAFSPQQTTLLFGDIWRQAGAASDRINSLPVTHTSISQTSKFLAQISDFAYSLVRYQSNGSKLNDGQWKTVSELKNNASYLKNQLFSLQREMEDGNIGWSEVRYEGGKILGQAQNNITDGMFTDIDKQLQKSPTLIYDGPFSENVLNITPRITSEPEITMEQDSTRDSFATRGPHHGRPQAVLELDPVEATLSL